MASQLARRAGDSSQWPIAVEEHRLCIYLTHGVHIAAARPRARPSSALPCTTGSTPPRHHDCTWSYYKEPHGSLRAVGLYVRRGSTCGGSLRAAAARKSAGGLTARAARTHKGANFVRDVVHVQEAIRPTFSPAACQHTRGLAAHARPWSAAQPTWRSPRARLWPSGPPPASRRGWAAAARAPEAPSPRADHGSTARLGRGPPWLHMCMCAYALRACACACKHACMHAPLYVCICAHVCVCVCLCMCVCQCKQGACRCGCAAARAALPPSMADSMCCIARVGDGSHHVVQAEECKHKAQMGAHQTHTRHTRNAHRDHTCNVTHTHAHRCPHAPAHTQACAPHD